MLTEDRRNGRISQKYGIRDGSGSSDEGDAGQRQEMTSIEISGI